MKKQGYGQKHPYLAQIFYIFKHLVSVRRDSQNRFERLKACRTPTDMVLLLNGNERRFCPKAYGAKPDECKESCGRCIVQWLEEMAQ